MNKDLIKIIASLATAWVVWVSATLFRHEAQIAVLNSRAPKVARKEPRLLDDAPLLAFPRLPIPNAMGSNPQEPASALKKEN